MTISSNRMIELAISSDPTSALFGTTWSFSAGDLVSTLGAVSNAEVTGTADVMQPGDTIDLDANGSFEAIYEGRFNFTSSTFTLGDGTTVTGSINIIEVTVGGVSQYYMVVHDGLAADLDVNDLSSVTFGTNFSTSPNTAGLNFDDASSFELVCFARGTLITTDQEDCPVEQLGVGTRVLTRDHGFQEIRWIGSCKVMADGNYAPIAFLPGAIGNTKKLRLSRHHRICVSDAMVEMHFGWPSVLMPAHSMVNDENIFEERGGEVEYFHILFDQHELVISDGAWTESFFPTSRTLNTQEEATQAEIFDLFPELAENLDIYGETVRPCLKPWEGTFLAANLNLMRERGVSAHSRFG